MGKNPRTRRMQHSASSFLLPFLPKKPFYVEKTQNILYDRYMKEYSISAFVGVSKHKTAITLISGNHIVSLDAKEYVGDEHRRTLFSVIDLLKELRGCGYCGTVRVYCGYEVYFEWEKEYKEDKDFSKRTKDLDLWLIIKKTVENSDIRLSMKNTMGLKGVVL